MKGRAPYDDAISIHLELSAPTLENGKALVDYLSGVMDSLDGSHGQTFTYLPIIYEDDCQVVSSRCEFIEAAVASYRLHIAFLDSTFA